MKALVARVRSLHGVRTDSLRGEGICNLCDLQQQLELEGPLMLNGFLPS